MPAVPLIVAAVSTAATVYSANQANRRAKQATGLARRQAAVQNQSNVQAAVAAREREQTAQVVEQNEQAAATEMSNQPEVIVSDTNEAARRRQNRNTFRIDDDATNQSLRV